MSEADKRGYEAYVEGTVLGRKVYERYGFVVMCNIRRICCPFPTGIEPDYIVLRRIYLSTGKLVASSLRAPSQAAIK